jgi:hypothetical protein
MGKLGLLSAAAALVLLTGWPGAASARAPLSRWETMANSSASAAAQAAAEVGKPLYVQPRDADMPFSTAFERLVQANLTQRGIVVSPLESGSLTMRYTVALVPGYELGLTGGTYSVRAMGEHSSAVLVTAEVLDGETVLWRTHWEYEVDDDELSQYVAHHPGDTITNPPPLDISNIPAREMRVVGATAEPAPSSEAAARIYRRMLRK